MLVGEYNVRPAKAFVIVVAFLSTSSCGRFSWCVAQITVAVLFLCVVKKKEERKVSEVIFFAFSKKEEKAGPTNQANKFIAIPAVN